MNRLLFAAILLLTISIFNSPISAQRSKTGINQIENVPASVRYQSAEAFSDGRGAWLRWETDIERENLGFYVYRIVGGQPELASQTLIPGAYLQARDGKITAGTYTFFDPRGDANSIYQIESYELNDQKHRSDLISTQVVKDLTAIAGASSEQLINQSRNDNSISLKNDTALPRDLASELEANRLPPDPVKQRWVAAQPGVKIGVKREGFYRISRAELQTGGFDVDAPTALWQLYANGIEQAINVGEAGEYVEFYGNGIDTGNADAQTYFLIVGAENGKRIGSVFRNRIGGSVRSVNYSQTFSLKERIYYSSSVLNGDAENFFGTVISNTGGTINFNLSGVDFGTANASIDVNIQGISLVAHQTKVFLNSVELGTITGSDYNGMSKSFSIPTSMLLEGANSLRLITPNSGDVSFFSALKINFARQYLARQNQLSFYVPNYKLSYAEGFTSPDVRVFDTTNPDAPVLIKNLTVEQNGNTYRVVLPSNRSRVMFAVENSAILPPASIVPNLSSTLSTTAHDADLVIISYKDWLAQAEDWANYRRAQGLNVEVVNIEDIFDEFNYGIVEPDAIRNFLKYAKENWHIAPNYVLLIGDATYDPKNYANLGAANFIPTRFVDTIYLETGSDETLADFNNDGLAEIAVGRIPVRDAAAVTQILNKVRAFEQTVAQAPERGAVFASDLPNGYDFEGLSSRLCEQLPATISCLKVNRAQANANSLLFDGINAGPFLVNYSGHGSTAAWSSSNSFFSSPLANQLTNENRLSVYTMLTCLNGYFFQSGDSLSEVLLKNPNGGAAANWSSTGLTTPDIQEIMAMRFYNQFAAGSITRIGDLIKDAKTTINFGRDVRLSWVLLGDPTMKVR